MRKCAALVGLDGIDAAEVVVREPGTCAVWMAFQNKASAVGREFGVLGYECRLVLTKEGGYTRDLRVRHAHDAVLDPAARPAPLANELSGVILHG